MAQSYLKTGLFMPEKLAYGSQILYEVEQDNIAMKWALLMRIKTKSLRLKNT